MNDRQGLQTLLPIRGGILRQHTTTLAVVQQVCDIVIALACFYGLTLLRTGGEFPFRYQVLAYVAALVIVVMYQWMGVYHDLRLSSRWLEVKILAKAWLGVMLVLFALGMATQTSILFSRLVLFGWAVVGYLAQVAFHMAVRALLQAMRRHGRNLRQAVLVGNGQAARQFAARLQRNPWMGIKLLGFVGDGPWDASAGAVERGDGVAMAPVQVERLGSQGEVGEVVQRHGADIVYITLPLGESHRIEELVRTLMPLNVNLHWVPDITSFHLINHSVREVEGQPVLCLSDSPVSGLPRMGKWLEDKVLAALILGLAAPLMVVIAVAIKLTSPGPVLFKQLRRGLNGQLINMYKFRTMRVHRESDGQVTQATRNDPRVTALGAFLRATSLDELPQLYNVLQGRMSIVGPRPHALAHDDYYEQQIEAYMLRHRIKPGITGWAQVNGYRGETGELDMMVNRVKYDLYYINNWSLWFDFTIILMTIWAVITGRNAY